MGGGSVYFRGSIEKTGMRQQSRRQVVRVARIGLLPQIAQRVFSAGKPEFFPRVMDIGQLAAAVKNGDVRSFTLSGIRHPHYEFVRNDLGSVAGRMLVHA